MVSLRKITCNDPCLSENFDYLRGMAVLRPVVPFIKAGGDILVSDVDNDSGEFYHTGGTFKRIVWSTTPALKGGLLYCAGTELNAVSFAQITGNLNMREVE